MGATPGGAALGADAQVPGGRNHARRVIPDINRQTVGVGADLRQPVSTFTTRRQASAALLEDESGQVATKKVVAGLPAWQKSVASGEDGCAANAPILLL